MVRDHTFKKGYTGYTQVPLHGASEYGPEKKCHPCLLEKLTLLCFWDWKMPIFKTKFRPLWLLLGKMPKIWIQPPFSHLCFILKHMCAWRGKIPIPTLYIFVKQPRHPLTYLRRSLYHPVKLLKDVDQGRGKIITLWVYTAKKKLRMLRKRLDFLNFFCFSLVDREHLVSKWSFKKDFVVVILDDELLSKVPQNWIMLRLVKNTQHGLC